MKTTAAVRTEHARRYMIQLCKHFGHRVPASFDDERGQISFEGGELRMRAAPQALELEIEAAAPEALQRLEGVVASHLQRFAFREPELAVDWRPGAAEG